MTPMGQGAAALAVGGAYPWGWRPIPSGGIGETEGGTIEGDLGVGGVYP